jgi:type I restriction enzyme S subunit
LTALRVLPELCSLIRRDDDLRHVRGLIRNLGTTGRFSAIAPGAEGSTWRRRVLHEVADTHCSPKLPAERLAPGDWVLDLEDIESDSGRLLARKTAGDRGALSNKAAFRPGDVLYGKLRPYLNKVLVADQPGVCTPEIVPIRVFADLDPRYLQLVLTAPTFVAYATRRSYGMKMPRLGTEDLDNAEIFIPDLAEQKRIVAKVDELMALCDRLEAQLEQRDEQAGVLAKAAVARFQADPTVENLEYLFHKSFEVPPAVLCNAIRSAAMSGRFCESASPWITRPLKELSTKIGSGATPSGGRESYVARGVPLIRSMNVHFEGFDPTGLVFLTDGQAADLANATVQPNDVLLNITGASIGRVTTAPVSMSGARVNQHVTIIRPTAELLPAFLALFLASPSVQQMISDIEVGATRQALTKGMIEQFAIPVPPLAEQQRTIAKVNELMALVDQLESQIAASEDLGTKLLDALVAELAPSN